jgi:hypothetical protein
MNGSHLQTLLSLQQLPIFDLTYWAVQTVAMALTALLIPNLRITSIFGPILAVATLSVINMTVWSSDLFSALPNSLSTQTVTLLAINGGIFWAVVKVLPGIESKGILPVLIAPVIFTTCSVVLPRIAAEVDWNTVRVEASKVVGEAKRFVTKPPQ